MGRFFLAVVSFCRFGRFDRLDGNDGRADAAGDRFEAIAENLKRVRVRRLEVMRLSRQARSKGNSSLESGCAAEKKRHADRADTDGSFHGHASNRMQTTLCGTALLSRRLCRTARESRPTEHSGTLCGVQGRTQL